MFHRVVHVLERDHDVSWASFLRVLELIGGDTATTDLSAPRGRSVALTFDDGTDDHAVVGRVLAEHKLRGLFFVPAGSIGAPGYLDERGLRALNAQGHGVGSHGFSNVRVDELDVPTLHQEIARSKHRLEEILEDEVRFFAPPGGSFHPRLAPELASQGFAASRSVRWGIYRSEAQRWRVPCVPVTELTVRRLWVQHAAAGWNLPLAMRLLWISKEALPGPVRPTTRRLARRLLDT